MSRVRRLVLLACLATAPVLWLPAASVGMCLALHTWRHTTPMGRLYAALIYWWAYGDNPAVAHWLPRVAYGAAVLALLPALAALCWPVRVRQPLRPARPGERLPDPVRAASSTFGRAAWLSIAEARKLFPGPHPAYGGIVIGEAYRVDQDRSIPLKSDGTGQAAFEPNDPASWGQGGKAPLLMDPCTSDSGHGKVVAGSGGYKTTAQSVPTMLTWTGSAVVLDPPGQLRPMVFGARAAMGHTVRVIGPCLGGVNALGWINPADPRAETHIQDVLNWIGGDVAEKATGENAMFAQMGRDLLTAMLADLIFDPSIPRSGKTLKAFRKRLEMPQSDLIDELNAIRDNSPSQLARALSQTCRPKAMETFAGVVANAMSETNFLATEVFADMVSRDDFDVDEIRSGRLTVFVEIPLADLKSAPALGRIIVALFQNALRRAEGRGLDGKRVLYWIEEARELGRLDILANMMTADRKYGATIVTFWQSEGDLKAIWKDQAGIFGANASWTLYAAIDDEDDTAKMISSRAGSYTGLVRNDGTTSSVQSGAQSGSRNRGTNTGLSEHRVELIRAEEVRTLRTDEAIVFRRGAAPLRCGRAVFFRRPEMLAQVEADRFRQAAE